MANVNAIVIISFNSSKFVWFYIEHANVLYERWNYWWRRKFWASLDWNALIKGLLAHTRSVCWWHSFHNQTKTSFFNLAKFSHLQKTGWGTIPQFGGWDYKQTDYSMVFQRARANRKQQKADVRSSFGNEEEIIATHQQESPAIVCTLLPTICISSRVKYHTFYHQS